MTETTIAIVRPPDARSKPSSHRARPAGPATVSASALALHLDCSPAYLTKLESEGVLHRDGGGFDIDASRVAYLRYLRRERRQSPRGEAAAAFQRAKTRKLELEIRQRERRLMEVDECFEFIDTLCGTFRSRLHSLPSAVGGRDLQLRKHVERCCSDILDAISKEAMAMAEKYERELGVKTDDDAA